MMLLGCCLVIFAYAGFVLGTVNRQEWAMELKEDVSSQEVDMLAKKHGFKNFGKVRYLTYYDS